ncbi:hypothetical protein, partial [Ruminiclostridium cellobioparum]|uniref:hypothetical protein n=1 Tax=Ruminiclostridium cellobioparum TaxID=29355 RepID=UPI0028A9452F
MSKKIGFKTTFDEDLVREIKVSATIGEIDVNDILEPFIEFYLNLNTDPRERILYKLLTKKARNNTLQYDICQKVVKLNDTDFKIKLKELH